MHETTGHPAVMSEKNVKPRVLMIAYACNPRGSGEHWLGWGWAEQASRAYQVDLITTPNNRQAVEERARDCGINVHFVGLPHWLRTVTEFFRGGAWLRQTWWQFRIAKLAKSLHQQKSFALVHQTTFHSFRIPFLTANTLDIPSVWGPIAGGESVPPGFSRYLGSARFFESFRTAANRVWLQFPPVKKSLRRASAIFVSNRTTLVFLPAEAREKCRIVPPNALRPEDEHPPSEPPVPTKSQTLRLLYVGNCVPTRAIPLLFDALIESGLKDYKLTIVGSGPAQPDWMRKAAELGIKVEFTGQVSREKLPGYYTASDALVFPALRDSGGSALLEAMSRYLPVICLDWAGPGEMVDESGGIKVPVDPPGKTVKAFAAALVRIKEDPALRVSLARSAQKRAQTIFRWDEKFRLLQTTYDRLIETKVA
ncbi:MAG TPA: glycosyltransferase family 4 protein [Verrucomicrobiae bacterium]|nr:glycosyltransferase family 4 protein [Verrucomicrobiae bacterium]